MTKQRPSTFFDAKSYRTTCIFVQRNFTQRDRQRAILARYAAMRTNRTLGAVVSRTRKRAATPEGEETSSLRRRQWTVVRNIVASTLVTVRAESLTAEPLGIIFVGNVTVEINYVQDEIPGLRAVTIENGSLSIHLENQLWRDLGLNLLASRILCLLFDFALGN